LDRISKLADDVDKYAKEKLEAVGAVPLPASESSSSFLRMPTEGDALSLAARRELLSAVRTEDSEEEDEAYFEDAMEASEAAFQAAAASATRAETECRRERESHAKALAQKDADLATERAALTAKVAAGLASRGDDDRRRRELESSLSDFAHQVATARAENEDLKRQLLSHRHRSSSKQQQQHSSPPSPSLTSLTKKDEELSRAVQKAREDAFRQGEAEVDALRARLRKRDDDFARETAALLQERDDALQRARDSLAALEAEKKKKTTKGAALAPPPPSSSKRDDDDDATLLASKLVQKQTVLEETIAQRDSLATKLADARRQLQAFSSQQQQQQQQPQGKNITGPPSSSKRKQLPLYHHHKYSKRKWSLGALDLLFQRNLRALRDGPTALRFVVVGYILVLQLYALGLLFYHPCDEARSAASPAPHGPREATKAFSQGPPT